MNFEERLKEIGSLLKKHNMESWAVSKDLKVGESAGGSFQVFDGKGGLITNQLTDEQKNKILDEFSLKGISEGSDYDDLDLIPGDDIPKKKSDKKNEYDENPLIPD